MSEKNPISADIVIAGGGLVGLAAACSLSEIGLRILLVDAGKETFTPKASGGDENTPKFDARVSALTVASQSLLETLGAWGLVKSVRACPYQDMVVWDGEGTGSIHFSAADIHAQSLGHIVENGLLIAALTETANSKPLLTRKYLDKVESVELDHGLADSNTYPVSVTLASGLTIETKLLIGADGGNSFVREQSGFTLRQWEYGHKAIVTTVKTEKSHEYTAWQRFMKSGPLAFLPLQEAGIKSADQHYCSIVWSCVTERAKDLLSLDEEAFKQCLGKAFEFRLGRIEEIDTRECFPLWQRHTTDYVQDNIALIGDAAHTIHPLAGQGVNLGFADVNVLTEVITEALNKEENFASHQVLSRYQRKRKGKNLAMMAAMEGFKRLFESEDLLLLWLRNNGLNMTDKASIIKQQLMRQAMGI